MALCKNDMCMKPLKYEYWLDGYCSERCATAAVDYDPDEDSPLLDPTDATGNRSICKNRDEVDAMLDAVEIDPRLPKIIMLRKQGKSLRVIGRQIVPPVCEKTVRNLLNKSARKDLIACGLRL